jgi:hypothetical protein
MLHMPQWLRNQIMQAFYKKNLRQIRLLNDCWFFYHNRRKAPDTAEDNKEEIFP